MEHANFLQANRDRWNELTPIHERSAFYDVDGFRAGETTLRPVELEVGTPEGGIRLADGGRHLLRVQRGDVVVLLERVREELIV